jgi:hypothetical protein
VTFVKAAVKKLLWDSRKPVWLIAVAFEKASLTYEQDPHVMHRSDLLPTLSRSNHAGMAVLAGLAPCRTCALLDLHLAEPVPRRTPLGLPLGRASELEVLSSRALELGVPSSKAPSWRSRRARHRSCACTRVMQLCLAGPMFAPYVVGAASGSPSRAVRRRSGGATPTLGQDRAANGAAEDKRRRRLVLICETAWEAKE